jgi:hypothetical protein
MDYKRWLYYNCPKDHAWILLQNQKEILNNVHILTSYKPLDINNILYIFAIVVSTSQLTALIELPDGFLIINNTKIEPEKPKPVTKKKKQKKKKINYSTDTDQSTDQSVETSVETSVEKSVEKSVETSVEKSVKVEKSVESVDKEVDVKSIGYFYKTISECLVHTPNAILKRLGIPKIKKIKMKELKTTKSELYPYMYNSALSTGDRITFMKKYIEGVTVLDLTNFYYLTSYEINNMDLSNVTTMIIYNNYFLRDFEWCKSVKHIKCLDIINQTHYINQSITRIINELTELRTLRIHMSPQITIRCLMDIYKSKLTEVSLNYEGMVCQPNAYSGLISENEWLLMENTTIERLLLNSTNLSLDIIDYIRNT